FSYGSWSLKYRETIVAFATARRQTDVSHNVLPVRFARILQRLFSRVRTIERLVSSEEISFLSFRTSTARVCRSCQFVPGGIQAHGFGEGKHISREDCYTEFRVQ